MKICHIINNVVAGGAQVFLKDLTKYQSKKNKVTIIFIDEINNDEFSSFFLQSLGTNSIRYFSLGRRPKEIISYPKTIFTLYKLIIKNKFDIVNSHLPMSHLIVGFLSIFIKINKVITVHNAPEILSKINILLNYSTPKIFCSESAYRLNNYPKCYHTIINNGISIAQSDDYNFFFRDNLLKEINVDKSAKLIVLVGAIRKQKNYMFLVNLIEKYYKNSDINFLVCGGFDNDENFIDLKKFNTIKNLHFLGIRNDVKEIVKNSDIYLSCSLHEGLPIGGLEAFSIGIPCVLSPIEPHKIFENQYDVNIPNKFTIDSFNTSINKLLVNKRNFKMSRKKRNKLINKFNIKYTEKNYNKFYKDIIG